MKNKNSNEINNIKVNIKTSFFNEKEKNILNKPKIVKDFNKGEKIINEKNINPKNQNSKNYNDKINIIEKKKYNINSNKTIGSYVPVIQKCITVQKNQVLSNNIETKYNRNTSKNSQIEYLEPIKELQNNFSNQSLKIVDTKFVNINKNKYNHKINKNEKTKLNKNLSQIDDKYEDVIFHKKLKMDKEKKDEYQKKNIKDISSSNNNKNTNISSSFNYTSKDDEIKNKRKKQNKNSSIMNNYSETKKININNTSLSNNIKLIKENLEKERDIIRKNKLDIYYLKKDSYLTNKNNNILALNIDNSNELINNFRSNLSNKSGNNIIYARKSPGMTRVRSHEKKNENIYNNMS